MTARWPLVQLAQIADRIDYGHTASATTAAAGPKFLRITDIQNGTVNWDDVPFCACDEADQKKYALAAGDVVFARTGATTGKSFLIRSCPDGSVFASYLIRVRPGPMVDAGYLARFFDTPSYWRQVTASSTGTAQAGVNATKLKQLELPLPPLAEQRRIAAILDKADAIRRKRQAAIDLTEQFLRSAFLDMFGDPVTNPQRWTTVKLGTVIEDGPRNGLYRPSSDYGSGTPIVRIDSFYDGEIRSLTTLKRVRIEEDVRRKYEVRADDILINRVNSPKFLGKSALVLAVSEPTVFESNMMKFRVDARVVLPRYLISLLQHEFVRRQILNKAKDAVNQSSINQSDVQSFDIRVPPVELQQAYINLITRTREIQACIKESQAHSGGLFDSLVQRAFR